LRYRWNLADTRTGADRRETRENLVEVAARLLSEQGAAAVTTRAVALAAGVQAPAIYRLFGDKDGLLDAVAEHVLAGYVAGKALAADTDDPIADLRAAWDTHVGFGLANRALLRLPADPGRGGRSAASAAGVEVLRNRVRRVAVMQTILTDALCPFTGVPVFRSGRPFRGRRAAGQGSHVRCCLW
jgi:AcrR family transcriptional regulator